MVLIIGVTGALNNTLESAIATLLALSISYHQLT